ncbi:MAG: alpha-crystallin domain-containing protein [Elusimicrobiales bacterium]
MNVKLLWAAIIFLLLLVLAQAGYIYKQRSGPDDASAAPLLTPDPRREAAPDAQWEELEKWRAKVHKRLDSGEALLDPDFDDFFDDRFFGRRYDPFTEMHRIHRRMLDTLRESERTLFDDSWGKWYGRRMLMGRFSTEITRTDKEVAVAVSLPGLKAGTADINITDDRIKISFSAKTATEEKSGGGIAKRESSQNYVKILPVPGDAVPGTGKVKMEKEQVRIIFERKRTK